MEFNINKSYNYVGEIVNSDLSITIGMEKLIDHCKGYIESLVWDKLQGLDFEEDELSLKKWVENNLKNQPPIDDVDSLWFGLFDGISNGYEVCSLYLSGASSENDEEDNELYLPDDRYADSMALRDMSIILKNESSNVREVGEYILYLGYACLVVKNIFKTLDWGILQNLSNLCELVVGFDSGDYIVLGNINKTHK
ncbi:hypothetical protein G9F72_007285 [Clostridium estertheticum]|uniref:hypothetical protein n=1 Tax=Clostridium estertheticum TaxID=238834 RepID=UPI0013E95A07|nr:hypothetical protein [Clostridium estertheticum]MBZ9686135.1 hypothetical protein [Clostridium estertheticum]